MGDAASDCSNYPEIFHAARYVLSIMKITSIKAEKDYKKLNKTLRLGEWFTLEKMCLKRMATDAFFDPNVVLHIDVSNPITE